MKNIEQRPFGLASPAPSARWRTRGRARRAAATPSRPRVGAGLVCGIVALTGLAIGLGAAPCGAAPRADGVADWQIVYVQLPAAPAEAVGPRSLLEAPSKGSQSDRNPRPDALALATTIAGQRYRAGARLVALEGARGAPRVLSDGFAGAADPAYDSTGQRWLFAAHREKTEPYSVWELAEGAAEPRERYRGDGHCLTPVALPAGHLLFSSTVAGEVEEHGGWPSFSLFDLPPGADEAGRLTFNPSSEFEPAVLDDGRIAYSSWQHVGRFAWPLGRVGLLLVNADGTGIFPLTGCHRDPWLKRGVTVLDRDHLAYIRSDGTLPYGAGELVTVDLQDPFAEPVPVPGCRGFDVADVTPLADDTLVLSARRSGGGSSFGLWHWRAGVLTPLHDDPRYDEIDPVSNAPRPRPEVRFSTVVPGTPHGWLLVLDCGETDRHDQRPLRRSAVATVRVLEGLPGTPAAPGAPPSEFHPVPGQPLEPALRSDTANGGIPTRIIGEVPPAADGSVYLKVPADRPLRIQLLDRDGVPIVDERSWFWVRPKERRVCIGCHEDRELSPANAAPLAARSEPHDLTDPSGWRRVSFTADVKPILERRCALSSCHVPPRPTAAMNLSSQRMPGRGDDPRARFFDPAYANLLARQAGKPYALGGRRVHPGDSRRSPLVWMLMGHPLAPQYAPAPFERPMMEPHPGPALPPDELRRIREWIDLGAAYGSPLEKPDWVRRGRAAGAPGGEGRP